MDRHLTLVAFMLFAVIQCDIELAMAGKKEQRELLDDISAQLKVKIRAGKIKSAGLTVRVNDGLVTVTGPLVSRSEAHAIVDAVYDVKGVDGLDLRFRSERAPLMQQELHPRSNVHDPDLWKKPLNWDDGHWQLRFRQRFRQSAKKSAEPREQ